MGKRIYFRCLILVLVLSAVFSLCTSAFLSLSNFDNILSATSVVGLLAIGATFVIAGGEIDLSVASVMALSGTIAAWFSLNVFPSPILTLATSCLVGVTCGLITGGLVNLTRAPSFIISLGMLSVARALAYIVSDGTPIYGLPENVTLLGQGRLFSVSGPVLFFLGSTLLAYFVLHTTRFGSRVVVLGDSTLASRAMGISVQSMRLKIFGLSGFLSGLAGFVFMARTNCGDPTAGQNYELVAITAVVLGGTKLFGGKANVVGTLLGVCALGVLQNGLNLVAVSTYYQVLFVGLVLICAAFLDREPEQA